MKKPIVFNVRKAMDRIAELENKVEELYGIIIRLHCELNHYKEKCKELEENNE